MGTGAWALWVYPAAQKMRVRLSIPGLDAADAESDAEMDEQCVERVC